MVRSISRGGAAGLAAIALLIVLAVLASGVLGRTGAPAPSGPPPSGSPTVSPSPSPSDDPSPQPTKAPADGDFRFDLKVPTPHTVRAVVVDRSGTVTGARSGNPGDGMSVRWFDANVANVDADTIRITWVALPQDDTVRITVFERDGAVHVEIDQAAPPANSDALGNDRVVEIDLKAAVDADDVVVTISR